MNVSRGKDRLDDFLVAPDATIRQVMARIDRNTEGIALAVDAEKRLLATITDGDIRRAILASVNLDAPVATILENRMSSPVTAPTGTSDQELLDLMVRHTLRQIPLTDDDGRVVDLGLLTQLVREADRPLSAVVMAGGFGTRLRPLTEHLPKPMLPIGDRPLLERIIGQLREARIHQVSVTTHYRGDVIQDHFGNGDEFGVAITYVPESEPRGTAGSLSLVAVRDEPLLVLNGDILTDLNFRAMLDFHESNNAALTVAVREHVLTVPYGVVQQENARVTGISEKPDIRLFINAGIYLLSPHAVRRIPTDQRYDMPDLIRSLLDEGQVVVSFPIREYWRDIGELEEYHEAIAEYREPETE